MEVMSVSHEELPAFTGIPASELRLRFFMQHKILLMKFKEARIKDLSLFIMQAIIFCKMVKKSITKH